MRRRRHRDTNDAPRAAAGFSRCDGAVQRARREGKEGALLLEQEQQTTLETARRAAVATAPTDQRRVGHLCHLDDDDVLPSRRAGAAAARARLSHRGPAEAVERAGELLRGRLKQLLLLVAALLIAFIFAAETQQGGRYRRGRVRQRRRIDGARRPFRPRGGTARGGAVARRDRPANRERRRRRRRIGPFDDAPRARVRVPRAPRPRRR